MAEEENHTFKQVFIFIIPILMEFLDRAKDASHSFQEVAMP